MALVENYSINLILLLAAILRLFHIDKRDFWYDEAFTGIAVKEKFSDMMSMIIQDVHPPLYYISAKVFSSLFGYSVFGIRLYSAIFGVLGVWAVYLFTKELFSKKAALWASLITAISPFAIQYSQEARMYSMLGFLVVIASYFFIKGLRTNKTAYYVLWGFSLGLAALTHYMGIIFSPVFYFVFLVWNLAKNGTLKKKLDLLDFIKKILPNVRLMLGYCIAFLVFIPWLTSFSRHLSGGSDLHWTLPAKLSDIFTDTQIFLFGNPLGAMSSGVPAPNELDWISGMTVFSFVASFIFSISAFLLKKEKGKTVMLLIFSVGFMLIVFLLSLAGKHYFVSRFLIAAAYFVFVLIGAWLAEIRAKSSFVALAVYLVLLASVVNGGYSQGFNQLSKNREKYKNNNLYILNSFDYVIAKYYIGADKITLYNIDWPQYDSSGWSAIGKNLKKTENYDDLRKDQSGLIIYNTQVPFESRSDKSFNPSNLELVGKYDNLAIYRSKRFKEGK